MWGRLQDVKNHLRSFDRVFRNWPYKGCSLLCWEFEHPTTCPPIFRHIAVEDLLKEMNK